MHTRCRDLQGLRADSSASSPRSTSAASTPRRWSLPGASSADGGLRSRSADHPGGPHVC